MTNPYIHEDGEKYWTNSQGHYHREGGPAIENEEQKIWYQNGFEHRVDGPSDITSTGDKNWAILGHSIHYSCKDGPNIFNIWPRRIEEVFLHHIYDVKLRHNINETFKSRLRTLTDK